MLTLCKGVEECAESFLEICSDLFSKKRIVAGNAMLATHEHQRCPAVLVHRCPGRSDGHGNQRDLNSNAQTHSSTCWTWSWPVVYVTRYNSLWFHDHRRTSQQVKWEFITLFDLTPVVPEATSVVRDPNVPQTLRRWLCLNMWRNAHFSGDSLAWFPRFLVREK